MRSATRLACLICLPWLALPTMAAAPSQIGATSPAGTWQQVDDKTGKVISLVRIDLIHGTLKGTVLKVMNLNPFFIARNGNPPVCALCQGKRHDQPIVGMVVLWGLRKDGNQWDGGHGLDPSNGNIYKVELHLVDHGRKLKVRGYVGIPLFGRTQTWRREAK